MHPFRRLQYKTRVGLLLVAIMSVVLLNNLVGRSGFSTINHSISAIYADRLLPATYIFRLTDHLYQKRMLHEQVIRGGAPDAIARMKTHDAAIRSLVAAYEKTQLTAEERKCWIAFRKQLTAYNSLEAGGAYSAQLAALRFDEVLNSLNVLSNIQAGEGNHLRESSAALISRSTAGATLEIGLMLVLGVFTIHLIGASRQAFLQAPQNPSLN